MHKDYISAGEVSRRLRPYLQCAPSESTNCASTPPKSCFLGGVEKDALGAQVLVEGFMGAACRHGKKPPVGPSFGKVAAHTIPAAPSATVIHPERPVVSRRFRGR